MHRTILSLATLVLSASQLWSQSESALPADAQSLRKAYIQAKDRAIEPLTIKYKAELAKLLEIHTRAGRLDEALAIRKEIESLEVASSDSPTVTQLARSSVKAEKLRAELSGSRWKLTGYSQPFIMTLEPDGKISYEPSAQAPRTNAWFVDESGNFFTREPTAPDPRESTLERGNTVFRMFWGGERTATRIKDK